MSDLMEEAVEAAWAAMREVMQGECLQELADGSCDNPVSCQCRREVRAALEAALPLIVGGERERCAKIAEDQVDPLLSSVPSKVAGDIAAAIRADTGGGTE